MRMPNSREISDEQEEIYMDAPMDGAVMVAGPPGTGKTVIAFLRAQALNKRKKSATVMMYGKVLRKYASNVADQQGDKVPTSTLLAWMYKWWESHKIKSKSVARENIYLNCPFSEKDEVKKLGAKFHGSKKKWWITSDVYNENPELFERWLTAGFEEAKETESFTAPKIDGRPDWQLMFQKLAVHIGENKPVQSTGHLIIDEAQDFPPELFRLLRYAQMNMDRSGLTILADENQRLNEDQNSTISQINKELNIPVERQYLLTENFRNTQEIAKLSAHFYVGLPTGKPTPPSRKGGKPVLVKAESQDGQVQYIVDAVTNRAFGEVGVLAQNDAARQELYNKLQHRLRGKYRVQSYSSTDKHKADFPVEDLVFDKKGTLTVLNRHSCKGLEFDAVFIPDIQSMPIDGSNLDTFKMNMYVMCSRARQALYLLYASGTGQEPDIVRYLPDKATGILEFSND